MKTTLTIAGSDPSGGAGAQADLAAFAAFGVRGLSTITALTVQDYETVKEVRPVPARVVRAQAETVMDAFAVGSVKIGMLGTVANARAVRRLLAERRSPKVVLDPVMASTSGASLLTGKDALGEMKRLIRLAYVVTPNTTEAGILADMEVRGVKDAEEAARGIHALGPAFVLVKGGHLGGAPVDVLYDGKSFTRFRGKRLKGGRGRFHGTGCMLSAGIAAGLALGRGMERAVGDAKEYLTEVLRARPL